MVLPTLCDDLNTPGALGALFREINLHKPDQLFPEHAATQLTELDAILFALGLNLEATELPKADIPAAITALADKRWAAKQAKDWAGADTLRKELAAAGWSMLDGKDGYKLESVKK